MKKCPPSSLIFSLFAFLTYQVNTKSIQNVKNPTFITSSATKGPPILNEVVDKVIARARDNVDMKCPIGGSPPSMYEWYKNEGERIVDWDRFHFSPNPNDPHLQIWSVTHEDSAIYTCRAINGFGQMISKIQLSVIGDDPFKDNLLKSSTSKRSNYNGSQNGKPEILIDQLPPSDKILRKSKGDSLILKCEAKGNPKPNATWTKDNQVLVASKDNVSSLKLSNLNESSNGLYKCEATNKFGTSTYEIHVVITGSWIGKAEILGLSPTNLTLFPGESGNITCVARFESEPHPMFFWVKKLNEKPDPESQKVVYHENEPYEVLTLTRPKWNEKEKSVFTTDLVLTNVSRADTGSYHCVVYGLMGYIHSEARVFVQNDPAHVQNIRLNKEKGVTVQWVVLWASAFLIVAVMIVTCFVRLYGCRGQPKRVPVLRTPIPKKSPGETVSTMLTQQNDVCHSLVNDNMTITSTSASAKRVIDRSIRCCPSGLSGLPESDVTDIMLNTGRTTQSHHHHTKFNLYPSVTNSDIDSSYHFFPTRSSRQRNDYLPQESYDARAFNLEKRKTFRNGQGNSGSNSRKRHKDFSDINFFPSSSTSAYCQTNGKESGHFSCSSTSLTSNDAIRAFEYYSQDYYQPPCSPVSTHSYSKQIYCGQ